MSEALVWHVDRFDELDVCKLYSILHLRADVFVVEQKAPYLDPDNKDQKSLHLQAYINDDLVAYCRLFKRGDYFDQACIGRVVVSSKYRMSGFGHLLMQKAIELQETLLGETQITISAQLYLRKFYESHGFVKTSDVYQEDGIPHIQMKLNQ